MFYQSNYSAQKILITGGYGVVGRFIRAEFRENIDANKLKSIISNNFTNVHAYISSKIKGEHLARQFVQEDNYACIAIRLGWVNSFNTPYPPGPAPYPIAPLVWLSHQDLKNLMIKSLKYLENCQNCFEIYFGTSKNMPRLVDIEAAMHKLNWQSVNSNTEMQTPQSVVENTNTYIP